MVGSGLNPGRQKPRLNWHHAATPGTSYYLLSVTGVNFSQIRVLFIPLKIFVLRQLRLLLLLRAFILKRIFQLLRLIF